MLDVILIDDPQPSGMIPYMKQANPEALLIYRSHIYVDTSLIDNEVTLQHRVWQYLYENIKHADLFISHPVDYFVPSEIEHEKLIYMPPSTDPLDGLNKNLKDEQIEYYFEEFNKALLESGQKPLDRSEKEYFIQIARFDPSKGILDVLDSYRLFREKYEGDNPPALVVVGNGAHDDPEGEEIYSSIMQKLSLEEFDHIREDIKVAVLPLCDQQLNALLSEAKVAFQLSYREGFEFKITEALMKGVPTIIYDVGGMILQIENEQNGYVLDRGDIEGVSEKLIELCNNSQLYNGISKYARENVNPNFLTFARVVDYLKIAINKEEYKKVREKEKIHTKKITN